MMAKRAAIHADHHCFCRHSLPEQMSTQEQNALMEHHLVRRMALKQKRREKNVPVVLTVQLSDSTVFADLSVQARVVPDQLLQTLR